MTNSPGDGGQPQDPYSDPSGGQPQDPYTDPSGQQPGQPSGDQGYWQQQSQQPPYGQQPGYGGQPPGYGPPGGYPPVAYAPDHPRATTSLVLGILGIVACGILAPFAWQISKRTVNEIDASNGQLGGRGAAQAGYVMGIIGTILLGLAVALVLVWVVLLVALAGGAAVSG